MNEGKNKVKIRNILSLFDGISCGKLALDRIGIGYENYYASEIDKYAIAITKYNFPDTIFVGDVRNLNGKDFDNVDLIMGGSPCQSFSFSGKRQGMITKTKIEVTTLEQYLELKEQKFDFEGQSYLFWEFARLLKEIKPRWFLLENVRMAKKWKDVITNTLEVEPVEINSALVSAQNRRRLYWTNIPIKGLPEDKGILLKDILENEVDEKYYLRKDIAVEIYKDIRISHVPNRIGIVGKGYQNDRVFSIFGKSASITASGGNTGGHTGLYLVGKLNIKGQDCIKRIYSSEGKSPTLTTMQGGYRQPKILVDKTKSYCIDACYYKGSNLKQYFEKKRRQLVFPLDKNGNIRIRKLTPLECERLQTLPDNYTQYGLFDDGKIRKISDTQRYKVIGNGWTVDIIAWILDFIK